MDVTWSTFKRPDGSAHRQIVLSESSDWEFFDEMALVLVERLNGRWLSKLDGSDQRYWDLASYNPATRSRVDKQ